ncbi:cell division protein FtsL [Neoroseomonas lacus]|uniref:Cell division protein FtsL n=1 Tax=Neoroseomonas lacus TaxID=287609 RepID=A0A917KD44_9PROT|nr:hypothetical protein [Neoroseomonas lacus]GGJ06594.1 hypothetical protein GCM10011320_11840 [Neoroseomonas lacus]
MIRPLTLITLCAAAGAGLYLYQVKHSVSELDRELRDVNRRTEQARERTQVLRAEWAMLNEPDRLRQVAQRYLPLDAMMPTQFVRLSEIERRLPNARQFAGPPSLFMPTEPAGDGSATMMAIATAQPRTLPAATLAAAAAAVATSEPAAAPVRAPVAATPTPVTAAPMMAAVEPARVEPARVEAARVEPARTPPPATPRAAAPTRVAAAVQPAVHVEHRPAPARPPRAPQAQTVAANVVRPTASAVSFSSLGGSGMPALAPPVPIARAAASTLPAGMTR